MSLYLVNAKPVNLQNGDEVQLFLRKDRKSYTRIVKMPHIIPSIRMDRKEAEYRIAEFRAKYPNIAFTLNQCGKKKATIFAKGLQEEVKELPNLYAHMRGTIGFTQVVRWRAPPLSVVSCGDAPEASNGNGIKFLPREKIDDPLFDKAVAIDLEVKDWRGKKEQRAGTIYMASFVTQSDFGNYVLSTYEADTGSMQAKLASEGLSSQLILCKDELELTAKLTELFREFDPLWVFGHNVGTYDLQKLRDTGGFFPGVLGKEPTLEASCGFFKRVVIEGRCVVDTAPWSANWSWTPNNKLVTVGNYLIGKGMKKDLSYEEQEEMVKGADPLDITKLAIYNLKDSIYAYNIGREVLEHVILASMFYGMSPSTVCTTGRKSITLELDHHQQMKRMTTVDTRHDDEFGEFDTAPIKYRMIRKLDPKCLDTRRGLFKDAHVIHLTPFIHALGKYMTFNKGGELLYKRFMDAGIDPKKRVLFAEVLNSYVEKMIFDLCTMRNINLEYLKPISSPFDVGDSEMNADSYFGHKYAINQQENPNDGVYRRPTNFMTVTNLICDSIHQTMLRLKDVDVLNYSDRFLFARFKDDASLNNLVGSGFGVDLGVADVLSFTKGRVLYRTNDGNILSEEMDSTGRKGHRTRLEQEMVETFSRLVFEDKTKALKYVWETARCLVEGKMSREKLLFETTARMDNDNLSAPAMMQERSQMMMKYDVNEGDTLSYGYARLVNGFPGKDERGRTYFPGYVGDIPASTFLFDVLFDEVLVATNIYLDRIFGEKREDGRNFSNGTVGDLLISAFPFKKARDLLNAVAEGDPNVQIDADPPEQQTLF